jgi:hypothetical protein
MNEYQFLMNMSHVSISHTDLIQLIMANSDHTRESANAYVHMLYGTYRLHKIGGNWLGSYLYMQELRAIGGKVAYE